MNVTDHRMPAAPGPAGAVPRGWLWLGAWSLVAAGLMAVLLAGARTPLVQDLVPGVDLFRVALVVHVDLSFLVWFLACAGLAWSLYTARSPGRWDRLALGLAVAGTAGVCIAPFVGRPEAVMNNYVPVLEHPWFAAALGAFAAGVAVQAVRFVATAIPSRDALRRAGPTRVGLWLTAVSVLVALACIAVSWLGLPPGVAGQLKYDLLFWGGGHVLQFTYTLLVLVAWLVMASATGSAPPLGRRALAGLFVLAFAPLALVPFGYAHPVDSREHVLWFTGLMRWGGLACLPLLVAILAGLARGRRADAEGRPLRAALLASLTLFAAGGAMGFMIRGSNTMIPAHYHGSIVAVTLALMGLIYHLLPRLGRDVTMPRLAHWQPYLYAAGQLLHITGLGWSGGHGVQRKTAGAAQQLDNIAEVFGMGLMGAGGLVSVLGGVAFLVVVLAALAGRARTGTRGEPLPGAVR